MKKIFQMAALALMVSTVAISCKKKPNDTELATQATEIVKANPTASVEVKEGVAHLSGTFATQACRNCFCSRSCCSTKISRCC